jgi:hypothetical protein
LKIETGVLTKNLALVRASACGWRATTTGYDQNQKDDSVEKVAKETA